MDNSDKVSSGLIRPISKNVIHQICSGQVILTLAVAVKELVENSIDAGASIIDISLKEYGSEFIEVSDNGNGVLEENFQALTLKHYTSKIEEFSDLQSLQTLGFRGEALSSLCALADLTILTKHCSVNEAKRIKYDKDGNIIEVSLAARQTGTTVTLENLFSALPVRRKDFMKNLKREFNKMCQLLYAYCLVSKGIKLTCSNTTNKGNKNVVVATQGQNKVRENIISVFGAKQLSSLLEIEIVPPNEEILGEYNIKLKPDEDLPFKFEFLISSVTHGSGRSSMDRQFFYINSRPVEPTKIIKLVNQVYKQFNGKQFPFVYLNIIVESSVVDVNVTPDKRQIFLEKEKLFLAVIKMSLLEAFKLFPSSLPVENLNISQISFNGERRGVKRSLTESPISKKTFLDSFRKKCKSDNDIDSSKSIEKYENLNNQTHKLKISRIENDALEETFECDSESDLNTTNYTEFLACESKNHQKSINIIDINSKDEQNFEPEIRNQANVNLTFEKRVHSSPKQIINRKNETFDDCSDDEISCKKEAFQELSGWIKEEDTPSKKPDVSMKELSDDFEDVEIILDTPTKETPNKKSVTLNISLSMIGQSLKEKYSEETPAELTKVKFRSTIAPENNKNAEEELQKQLSKTDFEQMDIIGQFNLGFIITKLGNDLFIIDQHATDEKYNFEQLQANTVLQKQVLVNPKPLELTAGNESILIENEDIFNKNGFYFKIDSTAPSMKKVSLTAVPISRNVIFGRDDIEEMLFMLKDSSHTMCRPSRLRSMLASRACRKSVMIGKSLSKKDMKQLVDHMGEIEQPWNCPHGRPTIRHLINLDLISKDE